MRFLIDTDIGDDIDDILTISWALKKNVEIVGISTVYRQARERLAIVRELLKKAKNTSTKIYEGYSTPLSSDAIPLGKLNYLSDLKEQGNDPELAVDAIISAVRTYDDLVLLIIGAETNIAKACLKAPDIMKKAKLVIMGGAFFCHTAEWNIVCDPLAAKIVSGCGADVTYIPWDVTRYICIGNENYNAILSLESDDLAGLTAKFVKQWSTKNKYIPLLHDPSAFYFCLRPDLMNMIDCRLKVVSSGEFMGLTLNLNDYTLRKDKDIVYPTVKVAVSAKNNVIINDFMKDVFNR